MKNILTEAFFLIALICMTQPELVEAEAEYCNCVEGRGFVDQFHSKLIVVGLNVVTFKKRNSKKSWINCL